MSKLFWKKAFARKPVRYESHGSGPVLFLGPVINMGRASDSSLRDRYLERLTDRYKVVVSRGASPIRIGPLIADRRAELEEMGWTVRLVNGYRHELFAHPDVVVPLVRSFLDPVLLQG